MWLKCKKTSCFDKFVAWLIRYGGGPDSHLGLKTVLALDIIGRDLLESQIERVENCMEKQYQCMDRQVRRLQSAWAHAKCADCAMSVWDAKCVDAREMHG